MRYKTIDIYLYIHKCYYSAIKIKRHQYDSKVVKIINKKNDEMYKVVLKYGKFVNYIILKINLPNIV